MIDTLTAVGPDPVRLAGAIILAAVVFVIAYALASYFIDRDWPPS